MSVLLCGTPTGMPAWRRWVRWCGSHTVGTRSPRHRVLVDESGEGESGEASVEFIGLVFILVLPIIYLIVGLAAVQAGIFAVEAGAREAARVLAEDPSDRDVALAQIDRAFIDFHIASPPVTSLKRTGSGENSEGSGGEVDVVVSTSIPLPLVPAWAATRFTIPVSARASALIEEVGLDE